MHPWEKHLDPWFQSHLAYPQQTLYEAVAQAAQRYPDQTALTFMGSHLSYQALIDQIRRAAQALKQTGFAAGEVATLCLPNTPHAVVFFYAVNRLGGICNMVHPLTTAHELKHITRTTKSTVLIILDGLLGQHQANLVTSGIRHTIVCSIMDYLKPTLKAGFWLTKGRKIKHGPLGPEAVTWAAFLTGAQALPDGQRQIDPQACAVYLHSGGTTGSPKTIQLSSHHFNVLAHQGPQLIGSPVDGSFDPRGLSMVAILPLFHGFGLGIGLHTILFNGMRCILVPQFSPDRLASIIRCEKPSLLAAVPTLYEGLLSSRKLEKADLSCLKAIFSGGDSLPSDLKKRFDHFVRERKGTVTLREGYGLTETVTVCCVNPMLDNRSETVGLPLADIRMKVVKPNTTQELPVGTDGEFCISGPTTMLGYLNDPQATAETVRRHPDGQDWVHTGDLGYMDEDGYFHFKQRIKRIIKVSGIPVFPSQVEEVILSVPGVVAACVVGMPHAYKMQVPKAFVVADQAISDHEQLQAQVLAACRQKLLPYAVPKALAFMTELPKTKVGKTDFIALERAELEKAASQGLPAD